MWSLPLYTTVVAQITASRNNTSGMLELSHVLYCFGTDYDLVQLCRVEHVLLLTPKPIWKLLSQFS